jgi:hypothetical protein
MEALNNFKRSLFYNRRSIIEDLRLDIGKICQTCLSAKYCNYECNSCVCDHRQCGKCDMTCHNKHENECQCFCLHEKCPKTKEETNEPECDHKFCGNYVCDLSCHFKCNLESDPYCKHRHITEPYIQFSHMKDVVLELLEYAYDNSYTVFDKYYRLFYFDLHTLNKTYENQFAVQIHHEIAM